MTDRRKNVFFIACSYAFFWFFVLIVALLISGGVLQWLGINQFISVLLLFAQIIGSWTPTFALLFLFKKLYPNGSIKEFYVNAFNPRLNWKIITFITIIQLINFICIVLFLSLKNNVTFNNLLDLSLQTIMMGFIWTLVSGATGEESGWRGYLQHSIQKGFGVIKASIIVGLIWGFWHAPLWFMGGFSDIELIWYIPVFMTALVSVSIIIGICYNYCKNLLIPIWIHFMFNFGFSVFTGDLTDTRIGFTFYTILYVITAFGYIIWHKKFWRYKYNFKK